MTLRAVYFFLPILFSLAAHAQTVTLTGRVTDEYNMPLTGVTVRLVPTDYGTATDAQGNYKLIITNQPFAHLRFEYVSYITSDRTVDLKKPNEVLNVRMQRRIDTIGRHTVFANDLRNQAGLTKLDPSKFQYLPTFGGGVEDMLKYIGGHSNNELSSQYSVRGGNFDENIVYVNDFEIYRPFLVRSGQQEGLSFINPDLVGSLVFSTGGFQAKYGDKLSSVLDVTYKKPKKFAASIGGSLLGANAHLEGTSKNYRLSYLIGARYKSTQYVLKSLETKGDYKPSFVDVQALVNYQITENTTLEYLANAALNRFRFAPSDRSTTFGVVNHVLRLDIYFDGQEVDRYNTLMNGLALTTSPRKNLTLKFLTSAFYTREDETVDITGDYFIGEVQSDLGKKDFGQVLYALGVGTTQDWSRNYLDASVISVGHRGSYLRASGQQFLQWGITGQYEVIQDRLKEWERLDSAGYDLPYDTSVVTINSYLRTTNNLESYRVHGFLQNTWYLNADHSTSFNAGVRAQHWTVNRQTLVSPRMQLSFKPSSWKRDYVFRFAAGVYDQPPFYRELRDLNGVLHRDVKAQQSVHFVAGSDCNFKMWNRPFRFITEAYVKYLWNVNPYELDNVRIRYYANNDAVGYATGIDLRLNGEIVKDAESWVSVSLLKTGENLKSDYYYTYDTTFTASGDIGKLDSTIHHPGFIPRPTDQRVNFALFLQDYIPGNDNFKVHLNLIFATGVPTGPPDHNRYRDTLRIPPYRRVDIGFSALLLKGSRDKYKGRAWHNIKSMWASLEVFNLLGISNTISYLWIKDNSNNTYAVPNYLTSRRVNLKLQVNF